MKLEQLLAAAEQQGASDILASADTVAALRIGGELKRVNAPPLSAAELEAMLRAPLLQVQWARLERDRELEFSLTHAGRRFRGNAYYRNGALALAMRLVPAEVPSPAQLGIPHALVDQMNATQGLVLVTGAAGQGKSTTLASLIDLVNTRSAKHIITVEDPIEYVHASRRSIVDQREVGRDTPSFAEALRHVLRQSPDLIMLGEMRDADTVRAALTAAETGHLVISTLHTNDVCQAIDRIVDVVPEGAKDTVRMQLSMTLLAVAGQRLLRGTQGELVLACELMLNVPAISKLIREGRTPLLYNAMELNQQGGMQTMNRALEALLEAGKITAQEASRHQLRRESRASG